MESRTVGRYELTDERWSRIEGLFPPNGRRGGQWRDHRTVVNGVFWVLCSGAPWRDLPGRYGAWQTAHGRLPPVAAGRHLGAGPAVAPGVGRRPRAGRLGPVERRHDVGAGDPARGRGPQKKGADTDEPADHGLGRSRGGFGSEPHVVTDGRGDVLQGVLTKGNRNEIPVLGPLLAAALRANPGRRPRRLAADKGYSADRVRDGLVAAGIAPVIPMRANEHPDDRDRWGPFDAAAYKGRNVVERAVAKLKEFRRVATRYEKLSSAYLAMLTVANIVLYMRLLDS